MAATQRIHMLARAMADGGARVKVWVDGLDRWDAPRNRVPKGSKDGVPFEYLLGRSVAHPWKLRRILDRFRLAHAAGTRIMLESREGRLEVLYFNTPMLKLDFERAIIRHYCIKAKVPVVIGLCEPPWNSSVPKSPIERRVSPLYGVDGLLHISARLDEWSRKEQERTGRRVPSLYVPILVDVNEIKPATTPATGKTVLFAGAPEYNETMGFLVQAMDVVWKRHPDARLVITGGATEATIGSFAAGRNGKIVFPGYLKREELLGAYQQASALAIPLFADHRSQARFPTKIGEYLSSGRPVVTNNSGDISKFICNGESGCVVPPGSAPAFGDAVIKILENPSWAHALGQRGRQVAERHFHYAVHGPALVQFFSNLKAG